MLANKLSRALLRRGEKWGRACSHVWGFLILPQVPPVALRRLSRQTFANQHEAEMSAECKQTLKSTWKIAFLRKPEETKTFSERLFSRNKKLKALEVVKENQYFTASEIKFC